MQTERALVDVLRQISLFGLGNLGRFKNFAVLDAGRADGNFLGSAFDGGSDVLQVYVPAALGDVVGVGDAVTEHRSTLTDFAALRHDETLRRVVKGVW